MGILPEDKWAPRRVHAKLYGNVQDYTNQLKAAGVCPHREAERSGRLRFLLGFNFGYLGYPKQAVRELNKAVHLGKGDPAARKLHDIFAAKIDAPLVGPPPSRSRRRLRPPALPNPAASRPRRSAFRLAAKVAMLSPTVGRKSDRSIDHKRHHRQRAGGVFFHRFGGANPRTRRQAGTRPANRPSVANRRPDGPLSGQAGAQRASVSSIYLPKLCNL